MQRWLKKESQSPEGAASSIRFRDGEHSVKVSSSPAVQREESNERHKRQWIRQKTARVNEEGATAVSLDGKIEMSQRCDLSMKMPTSHYSLDANIEMS